MNDDALGRTLDKIYDYGVTELFEEIALKVMKKVKMGLQLIHADTTSISVSGNYGRWLKRVQNNFWSFKRSQARLETIHNWHGC